MVDLDLAESGLWSALQAVGGIGTLGKIPLFGLAAVANETLFEKARTAGFLAVFPTHDSSKHVIDALRREGSRREALIVVESEDIVSRDPSLNRVREIARDIIETALSLRPRIFEYGEDGPELFAYIENSAQEIRKKLYGVADFSLYDKELRHDFRNMIGSVTGFSELILMEVGLSTQSIEGLTRLRRNSKEFVEILDMQKAEATV